MSLHVRKQLPVPDGDADNDRIWCAWDDCEHPGSNLHKVTVCNAAPRYRHKDGLCPECHVYVFCRAQHRDYWTRSHLPGQYGRLGAGVNPVYM